MRKQKSLNSALRNGQDCWIKFSLNEFAWKRWQMIKLVYFSRWWAEHVKYYIKSDPVSGPAPVLLWTPSRQHALSPPPPSPCHALRVWRPDHPVDHHWRTFPGLHQARWGEDMIRKVLPLCSRRETDIRVGRRTQCWEGLTGGIRGVFWLQERQGSGRSVWLQNQHPGYLLLRVWGWRTLRVRQTESHRHCGQELLSVDVELYKYLCEDDTNIFSNLNTSPIPSTHNNYIYTRQIYFQT